MIEHSHVDQRERRAMIIVFGAHHLDRARRQRPAALEEQGKQDLFLALLMDADIGKHAGEKPAETRMGSGKGSPEYWVAVVKPGRVLFEMSGVPVEVAREAMRLAGHKLPIRTRFEAREQAPGEDVAREAE